MRIHNHPDCSNYQIPKQQTIEVCPTGSQNRTVDKKSSIFLLVAAATALVLANTSINHLLMSVLILLTAIIAAVPNLANKLLTKFEKLQRRWGINVYGILVGIICIIFTFDITTTSANAQFFNGAQTWMTGAFAGIPADAVTLFFNVLRALFLLYLGISLVRIVNAARNDEDWQNLARTPLIISVTIVVGDILTGLITGNAV
ncbi:hypothetical protein PN497_09065 [Sphaerospermopsis kisseleviana CS-549]|uniref:Uncharacterized protein n=2 Tax=Sphaerospermopsis TaxID=752201 RepID=A0A480A3G5_9CYAN|nr:MULTISPECIES: hypothetical protein [Sphaerospermopsis]MBD2131087.1 hypothetical protein [Sphaerospermopsis sp. FACHB-1094]MDB9441508.1 hypothetical protein [Sphaerospermopsis kisseleviana CS-549]BAZ83720.1 hypothetical protein NIES73_50090 [Sphaerospermopsis kisseleviana NIES-73]GCL38356.1 hypothetical protein SR1949_34700 [Sphaerospermopsis reniformis]